MSPERDINRKTTDPTGEAQATADELTGVGGAPPASVPVPAEDAPREETGPEPRVVDEPEEEVVEGEGEEAETEAEPAAEGEPDTEAEPASETEGGV